LLAFTLLASSLTYADEPIRIKMATLAPRGTSPHKVLLEMADKWKQSSGGRVTVTIYPDGVMGGEAETVRRMRVGQLQAALLSVTGLSEIDKSASALQNMPMVFGSLEEVSYVREKLKADLEKRFLEKGFIVVFWGDAGWVRFFTKEPMVHPDDLKRMKVFAWAGDNEQVELMKKLGLHPVPLETADILTALQTGMIDAVPSPPFMALAGQFYGPCHYMLALNYAPLVGGTVITKRAWDSIPEAMRPALLQAAAAAGDQVTALDRAESDEAVKAMEKRGLKVQEVSPEVEAEWRRLAESAYPAVREKLVPAEMFDEVSRLVRDYRLSGRISGRGAKR
jgi:TRAP-type C4-dicarboxylate transport system substrate-binding protein